MVSNDNPRQMGNQTEPASREGHPLLWALQTYQKIIRTWVHDLTLIEFAVLMQIVDRTVGWKKVNRTIGVPEILNGGRLYSGIGHAVKRASVMNALRSLESKGIIERRPSRTHNQYRDYLVNLDWQPSARQQCDEPDFHDDGNEADYVPSLYDQHQ